MPRANGAQRPNGRRAALVATLTAAMLAASAASASALVVHLANGSTISVVPLRGAGPAPPPPARGGRLLYHGGPIMPSNTNYALYWAPAGASAYPAGYQSGIDAYLERLAHDSGGNQNVDSVATQYGDSAGQFANYNSHFGGALIDTDPYPRNGCVAAKICLTNAQLQNELKRYINAHRLPHDLTHEYFLLTPPGVEDCAEAAGFECSAGSASPVYCAYHSFTALAGGPIIYSNDPFVTGISGCDDGEHPNNKPSDGALQGGLSHEHNESITDPEINAWYGSSGEENGDKCRRPFNPATEFGTPLGRAPDGSRYNQIVGSQLYWYQQEWSNEGLRCLQRRQPQQEALAVGKVAPSSGPRTGGTTVTITGSGFAPAAGATSFRFGTSGAKNVQCASSTRCTVVTRKHRARTVDVIAVVGGSRSARTPADRYTFL